MYHCNPSVYHTYYSVAAQNESSTPVSLQDEDTDSEDDTGLQAALYSLIAVVVVLIVVFVLVCRYKRRDRPRKKTKPGKEAFLPSMILI